MSVVLSGCGGGGGGSVAQGLCRAIAGGNASLTTSPALTASFENAAAIFDGDLASFGVLNTVGGTGTSSMEGTVQPGTIVPGGVVAGVLFAGSLSTNLAVTVTTFLDGEEQDSGPATTTISRDSMNFFGIQTTNNFNSLMVTFTLVSDASSLDIHELCVTEL